MQTYFNTSLANMDILFCLLSSHLWEQAPALRSQTLFEHIIRCREDYEEIVKLLFRKIAEQRLLSLEAQYSYLSVDQYVIMPNHIHVVLALEIEAAGARPRPTITDTV